MHNIRTSFKEAELDSRFCEKSIREIKKLIKLSISFSVIGMPGMGISIFLRYLSTNKFAYFIHLDINELPNLSKNEFFKLLLKELGGLIITSDQEVVELCKKQIKELISENQRLVIIFNRFDKLKKSFNQNFFDNLRVFRDIDKEKIVMIFAANKPLIEQSSQAFTGGNLNMFSQSFYLSPYSITDLKKILCLNSPSLLKNKTKLKLALTLSGGHYQLSQLLLKSDYLGDDLFADSAVKLQLRELYEYLNYKQRKQLQKIALGKRVRFIDKYLLNVGFVQKDNRDLKFFTPLFSTYLKANLKMKLPLKELKLFQLLKKKEGQVVSHEEIFQIIWNDDSEEASDWALKALIYRLRKNPAFTALGYNIENHKKLGYFLVRS